MAELEIEKYLDAQSFAREVNLPLLGVSNATPIPPGAGASALLGAVDPEGMRPVVDLLTQTRRSLTLRSLLLTGFPQDPEFFAAGLALAREWSRLKLKVAVIDLDFWHPTVARPRPHPNEGFVDVLEFGCSFRRVAWEIVADALWVIGPGSHPPDEERIAGHPDWDRALRVLSTPVDVALYLAPLLDRKGFTGRISKRMDGVLLAASVEREGRTALRDAFLELWGSDAPMIGCIGIGPRREAEAKRSPSGADVEPSLSGADEASREHGASGRSLEIVLDAAVPLERPRRAAPPPRPTVEERRSEPTHEELVSLLMDEVRSGRRPRVSSSRRSRRWILAGCVALAATAGLFAAAIKLNRPPQGSAVQETLPAGTEPTLPAGVPAPPQAGVQTAPPAGQDQMLPAGLGGSGPSPLPKPAPTGKPASPPSSAPPPAAPGIEGTSLVPAGGAAPQPAEAGPYRVHVASFQSEAKVNAVASDLRDQGLDAWYERAADRPGWYRVFVGHYATHAEAEARASWLLDHGIVDRARAYPETRR